MAAGRKTLVLSKSEVRSSGWGWVVSGVELQRWIKECVGEATNIGKRS